MINSIKPFKYLLLIAINFLTFYSFSQDVLYKPDGSKIEVKVLEVNQTEIKYKKFSNLDGPTFVINKSEILMIVYQNGENEVMNNTKPNSNELEKAGTKYGRNMISLNPVHLLFDNVTLGYEFFNKTGSLGVKFPVTYGYGGKYRTFNFGTEIKIYPTKQGVVRYFFGPKIKLGTVNEIGYQANGQTTSYLYLFGSALVNNGISFQLTKDFNITLDGGVGIGSIINFGEFIDYQIGVNFGYRF